MSEKNTYLVKGGSANMNNTQSLKTIKADWSQLENYRDGEKEEQERPSMLSWKQKTKSAGALGLGTSSSSLTSSMKSNYGFSSAALREDAIKAGVKVGFKPKASVSAGTQTINEMTGKLNKPLTVDEELEKAGVMYANPGFEKGILLPLNVYDDKDLMSRQPEEWASMIESTGKPLKAQALRIDPQTDSGRYRDCVVCDYDTESKKFIVRRADWTELPDSASYAVCCQVAQEANRRNYLLIRMRATGARLRGA